MSLLKKKYNKILNMICFYFTQSHSSKPRKNMLFNNSFVQNISRWWEGSLLNRKIFLWKVGDNFVLRLFSISLTLKFICKLFDKFVKLFLKSLLRESGFWRLENTSSQDLFSCHNISSARNSYKIRSIWFCRNICHTFLLKIYLPEG